tara:strand:- start:120002 stop:120667 length:666 start_codon:yes stop_codon:yes gene_type:complete
MKPKMSKHAKFLNQYLSGHNVGEDTMMFAELEGFLAGIIVCPEMIPPSEWVSEIFGGLEPLFENDTQANKTMDAIMEHYNSIITALDRGKYHPHYYVDEIDGVIWEIWIEGFWRAIELRKECWEVYKDDKDEVTQNAFFALLHLYNIVKDEPTFQTVEDDQEREAEASEFIPLMTATLHQARLNMTSSPFDVAANENTPSVGRNDPCPCGSGKKYKKCCLH